MEKLDSKPDIIVGCTGGGSNFIGITLSFLSNSIINNDELLLKAIEHSACPFSTKGKCTHDFGDTGQMIPLTKIHTLGSQFVPSGFHAGGLRYHRMAPLISHIVNEVFIKPEAYNQTEIFKAGLLFAKAEGIILALEANHAVKGAIESALECRLKSEKKLFYLIFVVTILLT